MFCLRNKKIFFLVYTLFISRSVGIVFLKVLYYNNLHVYLNRSHFDVNYLTYMNVETFIV